MIIGHTTAALIAATLLKEHDFLSYQAVKPPPLKPFVLSLGAYQQLQKRLPHINGLPIHTLELSSFKQWGTMKTKSKSALGYSINSQELHDCLVSISQPSIVEKKTLLEQIKFCDEKIIFADGHQSLGHDLIAWKKTHAEKSISYVMHCTLSQPCLTAMQRYTPWGIFAWIPQSETSGTCVITTSLDHENWVDRMNEVWHRRLYFKALGNIKDFQIEPSHRYANEPCAHYLLGTSGLSISPILARGLNTVIAQCNAIENNNRHAFNAYAKESFDLTTQLYRLSQISFMRGFSLHLLQNPWSQQNLVRWGQQSMLLGEPTCK